MKKYLAFFKISLKKSLAYRARAFIWFFWDVGPALIMMFFWQAAFRTRTQVAGYDFSSMIIYYFVIILSRTLVLTHPDEALEREILSGQLNLYLSRPAHLVSLKLFYEIAYKLLRFLFLIPVLLIGYYLFLKGSSSNFHLELLNLFFFFISCLLAFGFYYLLKICLGLIAFWFTDVEWLRNVQELIFWFLGGLLLPLDIVPPLFQKLASFLPFKYVFYLPAQGLLGKLSLSQMLFSLLIQFFWLSLFLFLVKKILRAGLKVYNVFGG